MTRRWKEECAPIDDSQNEDVSSTFSLTVFLDASNVLVLQMFIHGKNMSVHPERHVYYISR